MGYISHLVPAQRTSAEDPDRRARTRRSTPRKAESLSPTIPLVSNTQLTFIQGAKVDPWREVAARFRTNSCQRDFWKWETAQEKRIAEIGKLGDRLLDMIDGAEQALLDRLYCLIRKGIEDPHSSENLKQEVEVEDDDSLQASAVNLQEGEFLFTPFKFAADANLRNQNYTERNSRLKK